jgi:sterol desaturase/sphingolipid hydroxylase (fatty acid hydroxylase superfamily)
MQRVVLAAVSQNDRAKLMVNLAILHWVNVFWHAIWEIGVNLKMWGVYHVEHLFFEKYKINSKPWPWYENP